MCPSCKCNRSPLTDNDMQLMASQHDMEREKWRGKEKELLDAKKITRAEVRSSANFLVHDFSSSSLSIDSPIL